MASPKQRGRGKKTRIWKEEEDVLIEVLDDLVIGSTPFKVDNGFKHGFLNTVGEVLRAKLPRSGLKAFPHINLRVRNFRGVHSIIHNMVVENCTSGFGFRDEISGD